MTERLRHWNALKKTDPEHTKKFNRAGGFRGTAAKPIYLIERMTEHFGPAGIGWGNTEPRFTVERFGDEVLVFCVLGIWYLDGAERSAPIYGTGGDNLRLKRSGEILPNDEAFKAAQTDAMANAMKLIGVMADVHMGLHDDDKYVRDLRREFSASPARDHGTDTGRFRITGLSKEAGAVGWATACEAMLRKAMSRAELDEIAADNRDGWARLKEVAPDLEQFLMDLYDQRYRELAPKDQ